MTAIFVGNGLGLFGSSLTQLNGYGASGNSAVGGQGTNQAYVDAATGNLVIQSQDEFVKAIGLDDPLLRTYNAQGLINVMPGGMDSASDGWRMSVYRGLSDSPTSQTPPLSTGNPPPPIYRTGPDGHVDTFNYNPNYVGVGPAWVAADGSGANAYITYNSSTQQWTYHQILASANGGYETTGQQAGELNGTNVVEIYNANGNLLSTTDANGNTLTYTFGTGTVTIQDASGQTVTINYNGSQQVTSIAVYGLKPGVTTNTGSDFQTLTRVYYGYDAQGRLNSVKLDLTPADGSITDGNVFTTTYTYQSTTSDLITRIAQSDGSVLTVVYAPSSNMVQTVTDGLGNTTQFSYNNVDSLGTYTLVTDPIGNQTKYYHDTSNRLTHVTLPTISGTDTITYNYDSNNNITQVTDAAGRIFQYTYDGHGNLVESQDSLGNTITRAYDSADHLLFETRYLAPSTGTNNPSSPQTTYYVYDGHENLAFVITPEGRVTEYQYASNGERTTAVVHTTLYSVASATGTYSGPDSPYGGVDTVNLPNSIATYIPTKIPTYSNMTTWVGTAANKTNNQRTDYAYDLTGQIRTVTTWTTTDSTGAGSGTPSTSYFVYDLYGRLLMQVDPRDYGQVQTALTNGQNPYIALGNNATLYVTSYAYDGLNRTLSVQNAVGLITTTVYGIVTPPTGSTGQSIAITVSAPAPTSTPNTAQTLQTITTENADGLTISEQHKVGTTVLDTTSYTYDDYGNLVTQTDPTGLVTYYLYDARNRRVGVVTPNKELAATVYNDDDQVIAVTRYANPVTASTIINSSGNSVALSTILPTASGLDRTTYSYYDNAGRLVYTAQGQDSSHWFVTGYTYDGADNVVKKTDYATVLASVPTSGVNTDLIIGSVAGDHVTRYFYDNDGNRIGALDTDGYFTQTVYDAAGRVSQKAAYALQVTGTTASSGTYAQVLAAASNNTNAPGASDLVNWTLYDGQGRVLAQVDAAGYITLNGSYSGGNVVSGYDVAGNLVQQTRYATPVSYTGSQALTTLLGTASAGTPQMQGWAYDQGNRLVQHVDAEGTSTVYTYDTASGVLNAVSTATNVGGAAQNDASGNADARTTMYFYDAESRVTNILLGVGSAKYAADAGNPTQQAADINNYGTQTLYDKAGRKKEIIDPDGYKTFYYYDPDGHLLYTVNGAGGVQGNAYDAFGDRTKNTSYLLTVPISSLSGGLYSGDTVFQGLLTTAFLTNAANRATAYTYNDNRGLLTRATDALGYTTSNIYDAFGRLVDKVTDSDAATNAGGAAVDAAGGVPAYNTNYRIDQYSYNERGLLTQTAQDLGGLSLTTKVLAYDAFGRATQTQDANGNITTTAYDKLGRVITVTDALGQSTLTTYDAFDRVLTVTDRTGNKTSYAYNDSGQSMTVTDALGNSVTTLHNRHGQTIRVTDATGGTTTSNYDLDGNLRTRTDADGNTVTNTYTDGDLLATTVDANGTTTTYTYDGARRVLTRTVDPTSLNPFGLNLVTTYAYNTFGQVSKVTDPAGTVTETLFDTKGESTYVIVDNAGLKLATAYTYDAEGRTLTVTEGLQAQGSSGAWTGFVPATTTLPDGVTVVTTVLKTTTYTYDNTGRRLSDTVDSSGLNITTSYAYDNNGNLAHKVDANGNTWYSAYDADNRQIYSIDPLGGVTGYAYDGEGRVIQTTKYAAPIDVNLLPTVPTVHDVQVVLAAVWSNDLNAGSNGSTGLTMSPANDSHISFSNGQIAFTSVQAASAYNPLVNRTQSYAVPAQGAIGFRGVITTSGNVAGGQWVEYGVWGNGPDGHQNKVAIGFYGNLLVVNPEIDGVAIANTTLGTTQTNTSYVVEVEISATGYNVWVYPKGQNRSSGFSYSFSGLTSQQATQWDGTSFNNYVATYVSPSWTTTPNISSVDNLIEYNVDANGNPVIPANAANVTTSNVYDADGRLAYTIKSVGDGTGEVCGYQYDAAGRLADTVHYATAIDLSTLAANPTPADVQQAVAQALWSNNLATQANDLGIPTGQTAITYDSANQRLVLTNAYAATAAWTTAYGPRSYTLASSGNVVFKSEMTLTSSTPALYLGASAGPGGGSAFLMANITSGDQLYAYANNGSTSTNVKIGTLQTGVTYVVEVDAYVGGGTLYVYQKGQPRSSGYSYSVTSSWTTARGRFQVLSGPTYTGQQTYLDNFSEYRGVGGTYPQDENSRTVYDSAGRAVYMVDALNDLTQNTYDANGNLIKQVKYANVLPAGTAYTQGAINAVVAGAGFANPAADRVTYTIYDTNNRLRYTVDSLGDVAETQYDKDGRVTKTIKYATPLDLNLLPPNPSQNDVQELLAAFWINDLNTNTSGLTVSSSSPYFQFTNGQMLFTSDPAGNNSQYPNAVGTAYALATYGSIGFRSEVNTGAQGTSSFFDIGPRDSAGTGAALGAAFSNDGNVYADVVIGSGSSQNGWVRLGSFNNNTTYIVDVQIQSASATIHVYQKGSAPSSGYSYTVSAATGYTGVSWVSPALNMWTLEALTGYSLNTFAVDNLVAYKTNTSGVPSVGVSATSESTGYTFDKAGRLTQVTDAAGYVQKYAYDGQGNKLAYVNQNGNTWTYKYDTAGRMVEEDTPQVSVDTVTTTVNGSGVPVTADTAANQSLATRTVYDKLGNVTERIENAGTPAQSRVTGYRYDALGRQVRTLNADTYTDPASGTTYSANAGTYSPTGDSSHGYGASVDPTNYAQISSVGNFETFAALKGDTVYEAQGNAIANRDAAGYYSYKIYDALGRVQYEVDADRYVTYYQYDAFGNQVGLTRYATALNAGNAQTGGTLAYLEVQLGSALDGGGAGQGPGGIATRNAAIAAQAAAAALVQALGAPSTANSRTLTTAYDTLNRKTSVTQPAVDYYIPTVAADGITPSTTYQANGTPASPVTTYSYDALGNLVAQKQLANPQTNAWAATYYGYDQLGNQTDVVDPLGYYTKNTYDSFSRLGQTIQYAAAVTTLPALQANGQYSFTLPAPTAPGGSLSADSSLGWDRKLVYAYDRMDRQTSVTRSATQYSYNSTALGNTISLINASPVTRTTYDGVGNVTSTVDADGNISFKYYDALGRLTAATGPTPANANLNIKTTLRSLNFDASALTNPGSWPLPTTIQLSWDSLASWDTPSSLAAGGGGVRIYAGSSTADPSTLTYAAPIDPDEGNTGTILSLPVYDTTYSRYVVQKNIGTAAAPNWVTVFDTSTGDGSISAGVGNMHEMEVGGLPGAVANLSFQFRPHTSTGAWTSVTMTQAGAVWLGAMPASATMPADLYDYQYVATNSSGAAVDLTSFGGNVSGILSDQMSVARPPADGFGDMQMQPILPSKALTTYAYDALGNQVKQYRWANGAAQVGYVANPTAGTADSVNDQVSYQRYDDLGRVIESIDALGNSQYHAYDAYGHEVRTWRRQTELLAPGTSGAATVALQQATIYQFDALGHQTGITYVLESPDNPGSVSLQPFTETYDAFGEQTATYANGVLNQYAYYDADGRVLQSNAGNGADKYYRYDLQGNQTAQIQVPDFSGAVATSLPAQLSLATVLGYSGSIETDSVRDLEGRLIQQRQGSLASTLNTAGSYSAVNATLQTVTAGTATNTVSFLGIYFRNYNLPLYWPSLAGYGAGSLQVHITYLRQDGTSGDTSWIPATSISGGDQADTAIVSWTDYGSPPSSSSPPSLLSQITGITVQKQVNGSWVTVRSTTPQANLVEFAVPSLVNYTLQSIGYRAIAQAGTGAAYTALSYSAPSGTTGVFNVTLPSALLTNGTQNEFAVTLADNITGATVTYYGTFTGQSGGTVVIGGNPEPNAALKPAISQTVDRWGNATKQTDAVGNLTTNKYDDLNHVIYTVQPSVQIYTAAGTHAAGTPIESYYYDDRGELIKSVDANGGGRLRVYDAAGNLIQSLDALGYATNYSYDQLGRKLSQQDADGNITTYAYDRADHLVRQETLGLWGTDAGGNIVNQDPVYLYSYDESGNRIAASDGVWAAPSNNPADITAIDWTFAKTPEVTRYRYDSRGELVTTLTPLTTVGNANLASAYKTTYAYDLYGHQTAQTDGDGNSLLSGYDWSGRQLSHTDLSGTAYAYGYDSLGRLALQTSAASAGHGQSLAYDYTANGWLADIFDATNDTTTHYAYDAAGRHTAEVTSHGGADGTTVQDAVMAYDALGRLTSERDNQVYLQINYDAVGNRREVKSSFQQTAASTSAPAKATTDYWYTYDAENRVLIDEGLVSGGAMVIDTGNTQSHALAYDGAGNRVTSGGQTSALTLSYTYDSANRLTATYLGFGSVVVNKQVYDEAGRVSQFNDILDGGSADAYDFNLNGWLLEQRHTDSGTPNNNYAVGYASNASGNTYDSGSASPAKTSAGWYDAAGNLTQYTYQDPTQKAVYTYSYARYDSYKASSITASDNIYGHGTTSGTTTETYDSNGNLITLVDTYNTSAPTRNYVDSLQGQVLQRTDSNGKSQSYFYQGTNSLGSAGTIAPNNFELAYTPIPDYNASAAPGQYALHQGDTLETIAQNVYGDQSLWYLIADANGLAGDSDLQNLSPGSILTIPPSTASSHNSSGTFKPYDASAIVGNTNPSFQPLPPPKENCRALVEIVSVVVQVIASYFLGSVAGGALGNIAGQLTNIGVGNQSQFDFGSLAAATAESLIPTPGPKDSGILVQAAEGAARNAIDQGINIAAGVQQSFSWAGVAAAGIVSGGVAAAQGSSLTGNGSLTQQLDNWGSTSPVNALINPQDSPFSWTQISQHAMHFGDLSNLSLSKVATDFIAGIGEGLASNATQVLLAGHGHIDVQSVLADAFGQVLGDALVGRLNQTPGQAAQLAAQQNVQSSGSPVSAGGNQRNPFDLDFSRYFKDIGLDPASNAGIAAFPLAYGAAGSGSALPVSQGGNVLTPLPIAFADIIAKYGGTSQPGPGTQVALDSTGFDPNAPQADVSPGPGMEPVPPPTGDIKLPPSAFLRGRLGYMGALLQFIDDVSQWRDGLGVTPEQARSEREAYAAQQQAQSSQENAAILAGGGPQTTFVNLDNGTDIPTGDNLSTQAVPQPLRVVTERDYAQFNAYRASGGDLSLTALDWITLGRPEPGHEPIAPVLGGGFIGGASGGQISFGSFPIISAPSISAVAGVGFIPGEITGALLPVYQSHYNVGYGIYQAAYDAGDLPIPDGISSPELIIGQKADAYARGQLQLDLAPGGQLERYADSVLVNRYLRNPSGSGYVIPDIQIPSERVIIDGTIGTKTIATPQVQNFFNYSPGTNTVIIITPYQAPSFIPRPPGKQ